MRASTIRPEDTTPPASVWAVPKNTCGATGAALTVEILLPERRVSNTANTDKKITPATTLALANNVNLPVGRRRPAHKHQSPWAAITSSLFTQQRAASPETSVLDNPETRGRVLPSGGRTCNPGHAAPLFASGEPHRSGHTPGLITQLFLSDRPFSHAYGVMVGPRGSSKSFTRSFCGSSTMNVQ